MNQRSAGRGALTIALLMFAAAAAGADTEETIRNLLYPPLGTVVTPRPERVALDNGMVVYLLEDHDFPVVDVQVRMRVGAIYEPPEKVGMAALMGEVMRTGGSETYPGDDLDLLLETMGARLEVSVSETDATASLSTLAEDAWTGLDVMADVLRRPGFPEEKIDLGKVGLRTEIAGRNDEPSSILIREFDKVVYGDASPYGRHTEYATVEAITREDLAAMHATFVRPDRMIMTVYGDFDAGAMRKKIAETFGAWPAGSGDAPPDPPVPGAMAPSVHYAKKEGTTNSSIAIGHLGFLARDPDYATMEVLNRILGGGFSSRLFSEIRSRRGLAYLVASTPGTGFHHPGTFYARVETRIDSTVTTIEGVLEELRKIREEGVTAEELNRAKEGILNGLVFDLSSKGAVLNRLALYEFYGYPSDFLQQFQEAVRTVSAEDVQGVAQSRIRPGEFQYLVVGDEAKFDRPLASLGMPVRELDITIPEPASSVEIPEATAETLAEGTRLLKSASEAVGGSKLDGVASIRLRYEGTMHQMGQSIGVTVDVRKVFPDRLRTEISLPFGKVVQVVSGDEGWMESPMGKQPMPPALLKDGRDDLYRDPLYFLRSSVAHKAQGLDQAEMEGVLCNAVYIEDERIRDWIVYLDAGTSRIVRMDYMSMGQSGPVSEAAVFKDWRESGGVFVPGSIEVRHMGEKVYEFEVTEAEVNPAADPALFEKPADLAEPPPGG